MTQATKIGELAVRRSIEIDAPPERVWQEFASQERMSRWLTSHDSTEIGNRRLGYEPRVGGIFETEGMHAGVTPFLFTGKVLVYDPPRELTDGRRPYRRRSDGLACANSPHVPRHANGRRTLPG